jgi:CRISPR/Cas system-associated protein Cas5 (RAMP superfamily)
MVDLFVEMNVGYEIIDQNENKLTYTVEETSKVSKNNTFIQHSTFWNLNFEFVQSVECLLFIDGGIGFYLLF